MSRQKITPPVRPEDPLTLPTGSLALDLALGGGWPRGGIVEVFGNAGSGKTTLVLSAIAQAQKAGGSAALIDADHGVWASALTRVGIDLERMTYCRTNRIEEAFAKIDELVRGGSTDVIVLDSIGAVVPGRYFDETPGDISTYREDQSFQFQIDSFLKCMLGPLSATRTLLLISNQIRLKVGVVYGTPETTTWATLPLHDFATQRVEVRKMAAIKDGDDTIGTEVRVRVVKNRLGAAAQVNVEMYHATGLSSEADLIRMGVEAKVLTKRGVHHYFEGRNLGAGARASAETLREDAELAAKVRAAILG
jgi:recombination protein RecA